MGSKLPIVNLTVQQQLVKIAVLAVDVSEDVQVLVASLSGNVILSV